VYVCVDGENPDNEIHIYAYVNNKDDNPMTIGIILWNILYYITILLVHRMWKISRKRPRTFK